MSSSTIAIAVAVVSSAAAWLVFSKKNDSNLFPGPPGLPIIGILTKCPAMFLPTRSFAQTNGSTGNLHEFGPLPHLTYTKWAETYGPIFSIRMGSLPALVVNTREAMHDLFTLQASKFSGRLQTPVAMEVIGMEGLAFQNANGNDFWRVQKKRFVEEMGPRGLRLDGEGTTGRRNWKMVDLESVDLLRGLMNAGKGGLNAVDPSLYLKRYVVIDNQNVSDMNGSCLMLDQCTEVGRTHVIQFYYFLFTQCYVLSYDA